MIDIIYIWFSVFIYSFLFHELMHIKGQSIKSEGTILVKKLGMTVGVKKLLYPKWFYYSGGILAGLHMWILALFSIGTWRDAFFVMGLIQLIYGMYEGISEGDVKYRYQLYVTIFIIGIVIICVI
jgi:hypothetical protein